MSYRQAVANVLLAAHAHEMWNELSTSMSRVTLPRSSGDPITELITDGGGYCGRLMIFFGGMCNFGGYGSFLNRIYTFVWSMCFFLCASACFLNLWLCTSPYHLLPSDLLVAYIHVPVYIAWRFWRRSIGSAHFAKLVSPIKLLTSSQHRKFQRWLRRYIYVVFGMMLAISVLALAAFALPPTIDLLDRAHVGYANTTDISSPGAARRSLRARASVEGSSADGGQNRAARCYAVQASLHIPGHEGADPLEYELQPFTRQMLRYFMAYHAILMYVVIPPVVCVVLSVYTMILLVFGLHMLDWYRLWTFVDDQIHRFQLRVLDRAVTHGDLALVQRPDAQTGVTAIVCYGKGRESIEQMNVCTRSNISLLHITPFAEHVSGSSSAAPSALTSAPPPSVAASARAACHVQGSVTKLLSLRRKGEGEALASYSSPAGSSCAVPVGAVVIDVGEVDQAPNAWDNHQIRTSSTASTTAESAACGEVCERTSSNTSSSVYASMHSWLASSEAPVAADEQGPAAGHAVTRSQAPPAHEKVRVAAEARYCTADEAQAMAAEDVAAFSIMMDSINCAVSHRTDSIDETCRKASHAYLHLLLFNSAQLVIICANFEAHTIGEVKFKSYNWYWPLGDLFNGLVGVILLVVLLVAYAVVNEGVAGFVEIANIRCIELHMATARRSVLSSNLRLAVSGGGAHVSGVAITKEYCIMFVWAMALTIWSSLVSVLQMF